MNRRVRVGVLGAGYWASKVYLPALAARADVELVVVSRRDGERARRLAEHFGARHATDDWEAALTMGLDAVVVASPPAVHERQVCAALRAGAHVLCEKPFAVRAESAWNMVAVSRQVDRHLMVAFGWNHMTFVQEARRLANVESLGSLEWLSLGIRIPVRRLFVDGVVDDVPSDLVPRQVDTYVQPGISGGGQLPGTMSHVFGMAMYLTDASPAAISARVWDGPTRLDVHDAVTVDFVGGGVGAFSCATTHGAVAGVEWSLAAVGSMGQVQFETAFMDVRHVDATGRMRRSELPEAAWTYGPVRPLDELLAVAGGASPSGAGAARLGAVTVEMIEAAYRSVQSLCIEPVTGRSETADIAFLASQSEERRSPRGGIA